MKLSKAFKLAVLGLVITAGITSTVYAHDKSIDVSESPCEVAETARLPLDYTNPAPVVSTYDYDGKIAGYIAVRNGVLSAWIEPAESLKAPEREKYEAMKQHLSPACKQKLGLR